MEQIGVVFAPAYWSLLLRNASTGDLKFAVAIGSGVEKLKGQVLPRGTGIAGWMAESGHDVIIEDVTKDDRFDSSMDQMNDFTTKSIIGIALKTRNKVFGVIELINKLDGSRFAPLDLNLLKTIGDFGAIAIERAYYISALKRVANVDSLTGLYNRRSFQRFLDREIARAKRTGRGFTLMMLDIDRFKQVNDRYGHAAGDQILLEFGEVLETVLRKADIICRYGGDEFIVIMPEVSLGEAEMAKTRIVRALNERNKSARLVIETSVGLHQSDGVDTEDIVAFVDVNLYDDKSKRLERGIGRVDEDIEDLLETE